MLATGTDKDDPPLCSSRRPPLDCAAMGRLLLRGIDLYCRGGLR
jgi:hypothetical protein